MKTKNSIYLIVALFMAVSAAWAQEADLSGIRIENPTTVKQGDMVTVSFDLSLDALRVKRNNMLVLTPVLTSNENDIETTALPPVVVTGKKRNKILQRKEVLGESLPMADQPLEIVVRKNNSEQQVHYTFTTPYRSWMQDASLSLVNEVSGCADCMSHEGEELLIASIIPEPYDPVYRLTYVVPEVEVKTRSDRHTATFNFVVDRWELLRDYKGNASKFNEVDRVVWEIRNNPDLEITEFEIHGYASPEGSAPHNTMLAENRANAFADYLVTKFNIDRNRFTVSSHGEDWEGLRKAVDASSLGDKQAVLDIIDRVSNPDARDAELMKLSGDTYRTLLNDYYPPLRRSEYVVAYNVRPFDVEEAREIVKSNPKLLSLNEMYLVAQSYPVESSEFSQVFDIAVRLYPDSDIAILNSAAADIESGNMDGAIERMMKIADSPKVWNNLGVAHARKGDLEKAREFFAKAAAQNDTDAVQNIHELQKTIDN